MLEAAVEDAPHLASTAKFRGKHSSSGHIIVRDQGHAGMRLANFAALEMALAAELTLAEVAALRLYSGPMFAPMNYALRTENIKDWATTISCCYSAVLKAPPHGYRKCSRVAPDRRSLTVAALLLLAAGARLPRRARERHAGVTLADPTISLPLRMICCGACAGAAAGARSRSTL